MQSYYDSVLFRKRWTLNSAFIRSNIIFYFKHGTLWHSV